jgi:hypothetical protein
MFRWKEEEEEEEEEKEKALTRFKCKQYEIGEA